MSIVVAHPAISERYECSDERCSAQAVDGSPVPLCGKHLRQTFEFASGIVNAYWTEPYAVRADKIAAETVKAPEPPKPPTTEIPSWVYFVRIGDLIKIGFTTYPRARFKELRVDEVLAVIPGTRLDEKRCHAAFAHLLEPSKGREHFRPGPDLLAFIEGLAS